MNESSEQQPIVQITRLGFEGNSNGETQRWIVWGTDADGVERVYVEHTSEEEHEKWQATDPLWREAQRRLFDRLLSDPTTKDVVLKINIKGALDNGDTETAVKLMQHLSPEARHKLLSKAEDELPGT